MAKTTTTVNTDTPEPAKWVPERRKLKISAMQASLILDYFAQVYLLKTQFIMRLEWSPVRLRKSELLRWMLVRFSMVFET